MTPELHDLLKAYIAAIHKRLILALEQDEKSKTEADLAFFDGAIFCYQDALKILKEQIQSFGYDPDELEPILIQAERNRPPAPPSDPRTDPEML